MVTDRVRQLDLPERRGGETLMWSKKLRTVGPSAGAAIDVSLIGQDRPRIAREVTAILSELHVNVESFGTWLSAEPFFGAPLFHAEARLRLPRGLRAAAVQTALEGLSSEIVVDV